MQGILRISASDFRDLAEMNGGFEGSEHWVSLNEERNRVHKITHPGTFGLTPGLIPLRRATGEIESVIEAVDATPIEYLLRWQANNEIFGDDVQIENFILWPDQRLSIAISQPVYFGQPAEERDIFRYFEASGWSRVKGHSGHQFFYNFAFDTLAMDAAPRNCYLTKDGLQPFDVILTHPSAEIADALRLFPD